MVCSALFQRQFFDFLTDMISQQSSLITSDKCIEIIDENFLYTYCTARDQSQVDGQDIGSLEETAYDFIGKFYLINNYSKICQKRLLCFTAPRYSSVETAKKGQLKFLRKESNDRLT